MWKLAAIVVDELILIDIWVTTPSAEKDVVTRTWKMEVGGHRQIGIPNLRWSDVIREDRKEKGVKIEDAQAWRKWRLTTG